jgi:pilus assembly protein CpaD
MRSQSSKTIISRLILAAAATALLAGCANRDSITVGAVPDDYRTRHPIVISEKEQTIDIPVAPTDRQVTRPQRDALEGFVSSYDRSAAPPITIMVPTGSQNEVAANHVAQGMVTIVKNNGIPRSRIGLVSYQADASETVAPIRVSYVAMKAQTDKCGRWPDDLTNTHENKNYQDFGCSYQNNLAAQIANPADLLGPRKPGDIDAAKRNQAIQIYRDTAPGDVGEVQY